MKFIHSFEQMMLESEVSLADILGILLRYFHSRGKFSYQQSN